MNRTKQSGKRCDARQLIVREMLMLNANACIGACGVRTPDGGAVGVSHARKLDCAAATCHSTVRRHSAEDEDGTGGPVRGGVHRCDDGEEWSGDEEVEIVRRHVHVRVGRYVFRATARYSIIAA